jgi:hypothetical protein
MRGTVQRFFALWSFVLRLSQILKLRSAMEDIPLRKDRFSGISLSECL